MSDDENKSTQEDELAALRSIYEEQDLLALTKSNTGGSFYVKCAAPSRDTPFRVKIANESAELELKFLPPLILNFEFPATYPSTDPPKFTLQSRWLSQAQLNQLCAKLDELWQQNESLPILFTWITFLADDLFSFLQIPLDGQSPAFPVDCQLKADASLESSDSTEADDKRAIKLACSRQILADYDKDQRKLEFDNSEFVCKVCFSDKKGSECIQFLKCEHVFCKECMKGYFESQIKSGDVNALNCPHEKCEEKAIPAQVLELVGFDLFNRYDTILLKNSLNSMPDLVYCPRPKCNCPVIPEETLARCSQCEFTFCALCRQTYHGIEPCKISNKEVKEIIEKYKNGGAEGRAELVKRFGESRVKKVVEEGYSMELIENTSKQCPKCKSWMQKLDGCNKMTCVKCHCYFCWLCMAVLSKNDPYNHFTNMGSVCYARLFEGIEQPQRNDDDQHDESDEEEFVEDEDDEDDAFRVVFQDSDEELADLIAQLG